MIKSIAKEFNLIVEDADENPNLHEEHGVGKESLENESFTFGNVIVLGFYDDKEIKLASFFHEVGHKLVKYDPKNITKYEIEKQCWDAGLKLALEHRIIFSKEVCKYIDKCLKTHEWTKFLGNGVDETEARRLAKLTKYFTLISIPKLFCDRRARDGTWCRLPYPGHPKGCSNFPKCPTKHPDIRDLKDLSWYAVIEQFDLLSYSKKRAEKHPNWTERQCRNLLYWQGGVRKRLQEKANEVCNPNTDVLLSIPEASGVNIFKTMAHAGVHIQREKPEQIIKVMLVGKPKA